ncbi:LacI family transcriptional regulator [Sphingomonas sp. BE138]|uniref:LacI family DNA-binding transcriptional regulator n=1 Tax=Sphingomonas sp. BE138 TaxID=2817845 RepID=UPI002866174A|nr:LacI family DNA-binding transcriptional regulator [Sphingomonas sp. BE138]MDR6787600.1 LacI family transcriptional regulator [Sphingomonas sp. BE138]
MTQPSRRRRGVTIIDVARHAGVSPMSVSRVINGDGGVRDETRAIVNASIRALNYTPNLMARSLVTSREIRIGVIYSNPSAAFMGDFLAGVFEEASARAAQLILLKGQDGGVPDEAAVAGLIAARIGGVILAPPLGEMERVRAMLGEARLPVAVVGATVADAISVGIDDHRAARDMTRHLIAMGHRRIGFVVGNPEQQASAARLDGFRAAVAEAGDVEARIAQGDFSYASGLVAGERLLDTAHPPSAIFASNDDMAAAVVSVAHRRHLDVPGDLTVTGFDDTTAAITLWPPLTTIRQPVQQLAAEALQLLIREMRTGQPLPAAERSRVLDHVLVERDSTAAPAPRS